MWTNRLLTPRFTVACRAASGNAFKALTTNTSLHADWILLPQGKLCKNHFFTSHFLRCEVNNKPEEFIACRSPPFINSNVTTLSHENFLFWHLLWGVSVSLSLAIVLPIVKTGANHSLPNCPSGCIINTFR